MLSQINKSVKALKAAGTNKVRVLFYTIHQDTKKYKIFSMAEFNIITQEGCHPSVLKSGKLAKHVADHMQDAIAAADYVDVVSLDNIDNRGS